jgi:uncharacterized delta-60 repeat protein
MFQAITRTLLLLLALSSVHSASFYAVDTAFKPRTNGSPVTALLLTPEDKIWVGRSFGGVALLNSNGSAETTTPTLQRSPVYDVAFDLEGALLVASALEPGGPLEPDECSGSLECIDYFSALRRFSSRWEQIHVPATGWASTVLVRSDGRFLVGLGANISATLPGVYLFERSGFRDELFATNDLAGISVVTAALDHSSGFIAGVRQAISSSQSIPGFGRWNADGTRDWLFATNVTAVLGTNPVINKVVAIPPGNSNFIAAVQTRTAENVLNTRLVLLSEAGELISRFNPPSITGAVNAIAIYPSLPNDAASLRFLIAGDFTHIGSTPASSLGLLDSSGTVLSALAPAQGPNGAINDIQVQLDGSILVGGAFTEFSGVTNNLVRLLGSKAEGVNYVFWGTPEVRVFESELSVPITLVRAGQTNAPASFPRHLSVFPQTPPPIEFLAGESRKTINFTYDGETTANQPLRLTLTLTDLPPGTIATRPSMDIVYLDDDGPGTRDLSFNPPPFVFTEQALQQPLVPVLARQPDGKILVAHNDARRAFLVRLKPDSALDASFHTNALPIGGYRPRIEQVEARSDGKIYVAGTFTGKIGTNEINYLARLNSDGTLDPTFRPGLPVTAAAFARFWIQPDGRLLVNHGIPPVLGNPFGSTLIRLRPDGSRDFSFAISGNPAGHPLSLFILEDGSFVELRRHVPSASPVVYRRFSNGTLDPSFPTPLSNFRPIALSGDELIGYDPRGSEIVLKKFDLKTQSYVSGLRRYEVNVDGPILQSRILSDGDLLITGYFTGVRGQDRYRLARINPDGTLDPHYNPGWGFDIPPASTIEQPDGALLVGGEFTRFDRMPVSNLIRFKAEPSPGHLRLATNRLELLDQAPFIQVGVDRIGGSAGSLTGRVETIDGSAIGGIHYEPLREEVIFSDGDFERYVFNIQRRGETNLTEPGTFIVRYTDARTTNELTVILKPARIGILDTNFIPRLGGTNAAIRDFIVAEDGSVYLGGQFTSFNNAPFTNLVRLHSDLSLDTNFYPTTLPIPPITAMALRPNGQIIIGGGFTSIGASNWHFRAQLNPDLSYDLSFSTNSIPHPVFGGTHRNPREIDVLSNGTFLVASETGLTRFRSNNVRDAVFDVLNVHTMLSAGTNLWVGADAPLKVVGPPGVRFQIPVQPDNISNSVVSVEALAVHKGALLFGGAFTHLESAVNFLAYAQSLGRLLPEDTLDLAFNPEFSLDPSVSRFHTNTVSALQVLANGDILAGGEFRRVNGQPQPHLALLTESGTLREEFRPQLRGGRVQELALLPQGGLLVRGSITNVDDTPVQGLFKLDFPTPLPPFVEILSPTNGWRTEVSDAVPPLEISVRGFDPDGLLASTRIYLDGQPVATNSLSQFSTYPYLPATEGEHHITAIAEDHDGLLSTNIITFHVKQLPGPMLLEILRSGPDLIIRYGSGRLQTSPDLRAWSDLPGPNPYTVPRDNPHSRFYRLAW